MSSKEIAKELHAPFRKPTSFRKVITAGKDDIWSVDLVEMKLGKREEGIEISASQKKNIALNDGYCYIFMCIDCFTRYAWAIPMKDKTKETSWKAFNKILTESGRQPNKIWADEGSEFYNSLWEKKLADLGITLYSTGNEKKAVMVERLNRTIKTWMYELFTEKQSKKWIDILPKLIERYNNRKHSAIGMTPTKASDISPKYQKQLVKAQYKDAIGEIGTPKYALKDWVRIAKIKGTFEKGYEASWSKELFMINRIDLNIPIMYHLQDIDGDEVKGTFYESEIRKTKQSIEAYIKSVSVKHNKPGADYVVKVLDWKNNPASKAKFDRYMIKVEYNTGDSEWHTLGKYIGIEKDGVFKVSARNPSHILAPIGDYLKSIPELKKAVWDKVL